MVLVVSLHVPQVEARGVRVPEIVASVAGACETHERAVSGRRPPSPPLQQSLSNRLQSSLDWPAKVRVSRVGWFSARLRLQTLASPSQERLDLLGVNPVSPEPSRADAEPGATVDGAPRVPSSSWKHGVGDGWGRLAERRAYSGRYVEASSCELRRSTK